MKRITDLVLAGSRYNFLCVEKQDDKNCRHNEGYLFLLPHDIDAHQLEYVVQEPELCEMRENLYRIGQIEASSSGRSDLLYELARREIDRHMSDIDSWRNGKSLSYNHKPPALESVGNNHGDDELSQSFTTAPEWPYLSSRSKPAPPQNNADPTPTHLQPLPLKVMNSREELRDVSEQPAESEQSLIDDDSVAVQKQLQAELLQTIRPQRMRTNDFEQTVQTADLAEDRTSETDKRPFPLAFLLDHEDSNILKIPAEDENQFSQHVKFSRRQTETEPAQLQQLRTDRNDVVERRLSPTPGQYPSSQQTHRLRPIDFNTQAAFQPNEPSETVSQVHPKTVVSPTPTVYRTLIPKPSPTTYDWNRPSAKSSSQTTSSKGSSATTTSREKLKSAISFK
ncbi:MAG: hypothetical protein Q9216_005647 [Gyalolechia sp. 2 TL-2023]